MTSLEEARNRLTIHTLSELSAFEDNLYNASICQNAAGDISFSSGMSPLCHKEIRWKTDPREQNIIHVLTPYEDCILSSCSERRGRCSVTNSRFPPIKKND
ncbi:MAG: hypothetical protein GQ547_04935 [Methylophaga sp.]|nr:hypothetical protein [Methylophaga sp.]